MRVPPFASVSEADRNHQSGNQKRPPRPAALAGHQPLIELRSGPGAGPTAASHPPVDSPIHGYPDQVRLAGLMVDHRNALLHTTLNDPAADHKAVSAVLGQVAEVF